MNLGIWIRSVAVMATSLILKSVIACADVNNSNYSVDVHKKKKGLKKAVTTLAMLSMVLCVVITPVQAEQSNIAELPVANFFAFSTSGDAPFDAPFFDTSKGKPTSWYWTFGDGTSSTKQDPTHTYSKPGRYTVTLKVTNAAGSYKVTKSNYITVKGSTKDTEQKPVADFGAYVPSGNVPLNVIFFDNSKEKPTSWYWDFGDGATSTQQDPAHTYSKPGSYTVTLTVTNDAGSDKETKYNYIIVDFTKNTPEKPVASFSSDVTSGDSSLIVEFTDESTGTPTGWYWTFGDGDISKKKNPKHTYSEPGTYTVSLTSVNAAGSDTVIEYNYITVKEPIKNPVAKFSATPKSGIGPLTVEFTDKSTGSPTDCYWDFGDGSTSDSENPIHEYSQAGTYTVRLTATNDAGSDEETKYDYITVKEPATDIEHTKDTESTTNTGQEPIADFDAYVLFGTAPFKVVFLDESKGKPTSWNWDFGDGTANSKKQDPEHIYSKPGSYTIKLTVTNDAGSDKKTKYDYITVTAPTANTESRMDEAEKPVAKFSATPKSGIGPLTVEFTDKSTGSPTDWYWDFGDGSTSDSENPIHEYYQAGTYTVRLTAINDAGSDEEIKYDYITVKEPATDIEHTTDTKSTTNTGQEPIADFDAYVFSGTAPSKVVFLDGSKGKPTSWNWDFGDGTANSKKQDPEHIYSKPGSYTIKLTVTNDAGSDKKTKYDYITVTAPTANTESRMDEAEKPVAKFSATPKSGNTPLTVEFTDESTETPTSWYWAFGDGATSTQQNPTHTYSESGEYSVTLKANNNAGSDKKTISKYIKVTEGAQDISLTASEANADINLNTPDYKQPTQTTTQEQPQIYRIDPNSGRAECVSHEDAQSQLHLSNQQFNSELRKGEVLILRNGRLSISTQETIRQINDPSRATPLMAFAIRRLQQDATTFHGAFPSDYYDTFSRAVIRESIRLNGADAGIEAVGKAFGSKDFSQGLAALHLYEALARRDEHTGFDKVQHFIASAVSEFENTKIGTDIRQYGKEIVFDEIPSWFTGDVGYDPHDMLANNRGQAFGAELYRRYHPVRANPIGAAKEWLKNEFERGLTRESSTTNTESKTNTEEKPVAKFSVTPRSGDAPLTVKFTDQSTGNPLWKWWGFGDGTGSSLNANTITHTYSKAGTYTVFLKVTNTEGSDTETKSEYIIVTEPETSSSLIEKPLVISDPANSANFKESSRKSGDIRWIVIHDTESSYSSAVNTFKNPTSKACAHYLIRKDGRITQMVSDEDIAYHAGNYAYNKYSIGIEHEGYADKCEFTPEQYIASAKLVKWLCQEYDIPLVHYSGSVAPADPKAGTGIIGHYQVPNEKDPTKGGGKNGHYDPGKCWDWTYYMKMVNAD